MAKNKWVAALLSFIICGLGQLYLGFFWSALFFFTLEVFTVMIYNRLPNIGFALNTAVSFWSALDAYRKAKGIDNIQQKELPKTGKLKVY
ncbi:MAG: hypothetical protein FJY77_03205 [Candidatus Altiarchaeales archaeon]|nr:hypothetical protein [Candidatus Altiarchaeales archaeon]